ncbi:MAG: hypothetical protein ACK5QJ_08680, partial [Microcystis sp.]
PSGKPRAKVSPVQVRSEVSVDRISILYLDNSLQIASINHYTVSSISYKNGLLPPADRLR